MSTSTTTKPRTHSWKGKPVTAKQYAQYLRQSGGNVPAPQPTPADDKLTAVLGALGLNDTQANLLRQVFAAQTVDMNEPAAAPKPPTEQEIADALVEKSPYSHARGRVYLTSDVVEAAARVMTGSKPEIVKAAQGRTAAVLVARTDDGATYMHNLYEG